MMYFGFASDGLDFSIVLLNLTVAEFDYVTEPELNRLPSQLLAIYRSNMPTRHPMITFSSENKLAWMLVS